MISKVVYGPPDWLITKFDARDRRAFGFWMIILALVGVIVSAFTGTLVGYIAAISIVALVPLFTTETPVEEQG